ncbi:MAG: hypothetical protein ACYTAN_02390 [Planctomycetota bacterium]|jgi:hypothetical protein
MIPADVLRQSEILCARYLRAEMGAKEFIVTLEDWLREHLHEVREVDMQTYTLLDHYWVDVLAMYEDNDSLREAEAIHGYLGPDELRRETECLVRQMGWEEAGE